MIFKRLLAFFVCLCCVVWPASASAITLAVAANFSGTMKKITDLYQRQTGHKVTLVSGSTGKHYAQIINGAPFDLFFAADAKRPRLLEEQGLAVPNSRFTYAYGRIVLWSPRETMIDNEGEVLFHKNFNHLAMANPRLAPYGVAAEQVLQHRGLLATLKPLIVYGENVAQTFHFINSGNAELGFVAYSQIKALPAAQRGSYWEVPQHLYRPIEQQAVLLTPDTLACQFVTFVKRAAVREIIRDHGYGMVEQVQPAAETTAGVSCGL